MLILQIASIILAAIFALMIHRAGLALALRAIGSFFWSAADAFEHWRDRFKEAMVNAKEMEQPRVMLYCPIHEPGDYEPNVLPLVCDSCKAKAEIPEESTESYEASEALLTARRFDATESKTAKAIA